MYCIRYLTVFVSLKRVGQNWAKKPIFWVIFGGFSLTPSNALWVPPQILRQMKDLMKIHNRAKFHLYSICGSQVIKFQIVSWRCSIHEMAHFGGFLSPFSPKWSSNLLKFGPEVEYHRPMTLYEESLKLMSLRGKGTYPKFWVLVHFWAQFTPGKHKILLKTLIFPKTTSFGLSDDTSPKSNRNHIILIYLIKKTHFLGPKWP